jgi:plastocyanin domain-containing protein
MRIRTALFPAAAAVALWPPPALAQHAAGMGPGAAHASAQPAQPGIAEGVVKRGVRVVEMEVTGEGFVPAQVKVKKGEKVRLVITRKTDRTCATEIVIKDYGINAPLPLNKTVTVELTPKASGEIRYACAMNMIGGVLFVP